MKMHLVFLLLSIVHKCYGQDTICKVIVIDSILLDSRVDEKVKDQGFLRIKAVEGVWDETVPFENIFWYERRHPALCSKIKFLHSDDLAFGILIDDKGSEIELHHLEKMGDTIHIGVCRIVHNCFEDSTVNFREYYHHIDSKQIVEKYKETHWTSRPKDSCHDTLKEVTFSINGLEYKVPIRLVRTGLIASNHGYATKRDERRGHRYLRCENERRRCKIVYNTFEGGYHSSRYNYSGKLDFGKM